jgi:preprotein translocase subunit SecY
MKYCTNSDCSGRQRSHAPAGYQDSLEVCPECGGPVTLDGTLVQEPSPAPWRNAAVTLGVLAVCLGARQIALPTVTPPAGLLEGRMAFLSIMALGVKPLLFGYMIVEFAALLMPEWRPLRVGEPGGRAKLHRAALIVGMLAALLQAVFLTLGLEAAGVRTNYGAGFRVITVLTLLGATAALVALARIVDREGLGGGFSILCWLSLSPRLSDRQGTPSLPPNWEPSLPRCC